MATQTEAACLLETGALYTKRIMFREERSDPIFAGVKQGVFSLYYGDAPIYHFDLEGRWQRAFVDGVHYLKGLDGTVQSIDRVREGVNLVLKRRTLGFAEASDLDSALRAAALDLLEALGSDRLEHVSPPTGAFPLSDAEVQEYLESIAGWDSARWFAQRETYLGTYGPLPIVPPDCQHAVVLQATLGHAGGRSFGHGVGAEHYVRSADEFAEHAQTVARLLGRRLLQCKTVFVGGSDFLRLPEPHVLADLEMVSRIFPDDAFGAVARSRTSSSDASAPRLGGVHTFLDDFSLPLPDLARWARFAQVGLKRVHVGIESGDPEVRARYGKTWRDEDLVRMVRDLKGVGIGVSLLVVGGAGGLSLADRHLERTVSLVESLPLVAGDLVSLLDANELADPGSIGDAAGMVPTPLSGPELRDQLRALRNKLTSTFRERTGAKVAPYSLEKQGGAQ